MPPELIVRLLARRGIAGEELEAFFDPSPRRLAAPASLPGVAEAADAILAAHGQGRRIVVFGDYDCDGVCATALLTRCLRTLGIPAETFLPERITEGYGMTKASVARLLAEHPETGLVVTVDNGINSIAEIAMLAERGIDTVVTDHHLPTLAEDGTTMVLPAARAVVNPKVAAPPELAGLCGAGVAYFLAGRLVTEARRLGLYAGGKVSAPLLVLAGIATVTDIMPLVGQNRILVSAALELFAHSAPVGLVELHQRAARTGAERMTARDFGFLIGPRINAAGRIASGTKALDLVLMDASAREEARRFAQEIDALNLDRKQLEQAMTDEAAGKVVKGAPAQVIDLKGGHPGVAGIVAARVLERLSRSGSEVAPSARIDTVSDTGLAVPVCVVVNGHGSVRAPDGYNVRDAFVAAAETLERYGGHAAAGGFSVKEGQIDRFRALFCAACAAQAPARGLTTASSDPADLWLGPSEITLELARWVEKMEPFGEGNREPVFGLKGVTLASVAPLGSDGRHLSVTFRTRNVPRAVWWCRGDLVEALRARSDARFDVFFNLSVSDFHEPHVELRLTGIRECDGRSI